MKKRTKNVNSFKTMRGNEMSRRQLSRKIYLANKAYKESFNYLSQKEFDMVSKYYYEIVRSATQQPNAVSLGLKGAKTEKDLRLLEQGAERLLKSTYLKKSKYTKMKAGQIDTLRSKFNYFTSDEKGNPIYHDVLTKEAAEKLRSVVFASDIWHHLVENKLFDSEQAVKMFTETLSGDFDDEERAEIFLNFLENVEEDAAEAEMTIDDYIESMLGSGY